MSSTPTPEQVYANLVEWVAKGDEYKRLMFEMFWAMQMARHCTDEGQQEWAEEFAKIACERGAEYTSKAIWECQPKKIEALGDTVTRKGIPKRFSQTPVQVARFAIMHHALSGGWPSRDWLDPLVKKATRKQTGKAVDNRTIRNALGDLGLKFVVK